MMNFARHMRCKKSLPKDVWLEAIENTNQMAERIQSFDIDKSNKYPNVFKDPDIEFRSAVMDAAYKHPHAMKRHGEKGYSRPRRRRTRCL